MTEMILQPGPGEGDATYIDSLTSYGNYGALQVLQVGSHDYRGTLFHSRVLLRMNLPSLPGEITNATLTFFNNETSSLSQTVYAYRCTEDWTELGATWIVYNGVDAWPGGSGGNWDSSLTTAASVGSKEDLQLDVTELLVDALANRSGIFNLLLKTSESLLDSVAYYSSDEEEETEKRPRLRIEYIPAGSRVYLAEGGVENLNWDAPVTLIPEGQTSAELSVSLVPNRRYTLAARRFSQAGVEEHNTHVVTFVEVDAGGVLQPAPLPKPFDLSFERITSDTIRLGFSCDVPLGHAEPTEYRVYGDGGAGGMNFETPLVVLSENVAGRREFVVEVSTPALPLQLAVQAWWEEQFGPVSSILIVPDTPSPAAPTIIPDL